MGPTIEALRRSLEARGFAILDEIDIAEHLASKSEVWGPSYNEAGLEQAVSLSVCHAELVNEAGNADPIAWSLCPLTLTVWGKDGEVTIVVPRPTGVSGSAQELEAQLMSAVESVASTLPAVTEAGECRYDTECSEGRVCEQHRCTRWWQLRGDTPEATPGQLVAMIERGDVQLLDVRTEAEFERGHIEGAINVPLGRLEDAQYELPVDRDKQVVAICMTAHRSIGAVRLLERLGYDAIQLAGGMLAWRKAKLPEREGAQGPSAETSPR